MALRRLLKHRHGHSDTGETGRNTIKHVTGTQEPERRTSPRMPMRLRAEFYAEGDDGESNRIGTTTNVSAGGIYFDTSEWLGLKVGGELEMRLSGLSAYGTGPIMRTLRGRAKILRLDLPDYDTPSSDRAGVAVAFSGSPCFDIYRWTE